MFIWIIMGGVFILSMIVQNSLKSKFSKYSKVPLGVPMTGRDIAAAMLQQNGCTNVQVTSVSGQLTDHFNPANSTVNLSEPVYATNSIAAAAVAAHECGHAVQHKVGYSMLQLRTKMVPIVSFASNTIQWLLLAGIMVAQWTPIPLYVAIALFATTVLFSFVTLPVEVDASRRAIQWLEGSGLVSGEQLTYAKDALHAAAYTYVVAAIGSLATLLYYIAMIFGGNRR
ncbi:MAG: zinc metallopeptidase [Muribaculaceae bacterium]|nr:zinc metallopeptidase [Muribaculaceae bacterium]